MFKSLHISTVVMKTFKTDKDLYDLFPDCKIGIIYLSNLEKRSKTPNINNLYKRVVESTLRKKVSISDQTNSKKWALAFERLNLNSKQILPSHIALKKRIQSKKEFPKVNTIVDIYNGMSIIHDIPFGGHDVTGIDEVTVGKTKGIEKFMSLNSEEEIIVEENEFAYLDRNHDKVLTRNLVWRQSDYSKMTLETNEAFIPIDDIIGNLSDTELETIAYDFIQLLNNFYSFEWVFGIVSRSNSDISLTPIKKAFPSSTGHHLLSDPEIDCSDLSISRFFDHKIDEVYPSKEELKEALKSGDRLSFYIGADATGPQLHLGHLLPLLKLRDLQKMGHQLIFLIGDFTAKIGDPTDKTAARVMLSTEQVERNASSYLEQIGKYIDFNDTHNPPRVVFNSSWNSSLTMEDVIELGSKFTVQQMLERDMFKVRMEENKPIYLHEFFYPLLQGYDSVFLEVDGEFGGRDQTFNMLAGRHLEKSYKGINKFVITTHFLLSADGKNKMSKSIGNCIFIEDSPQDKYGKVMSIPDELIEHYYKFATELSLEDISSRLSEQVSEIEKKKKLAYEITKFNNGEEAARQAQKYFESTIQNNEAPEDARRISKEEIREVNKSDSILAKDLLTTTSMVRSNSEAKRLITSGALQINTEKITDPSTSISISELHVLKLGKLNWIIFVD